MNQALALTVVTCSIQSSTCQLNAPNWHKEGVLQSHVSSRATYRPVHRKKEPSDGRGRVSCFLAT